MLEFDDGELMFNVLSEALGEDPNCTNINKYVAMVPIICGDNSAKLFKIDPISVCFFLTYRNKHFKVKTNKTIYNEFYFMVQHLQNK